MRCHCMILKKSFLFCFERTFWAIDINKSLNRFNLPGILSHFFCMFFFLKRNKIENSVKIVKKLIQVYMHSGFHMHFFIFMTDSTSIYWLKHIWYLVFRMSEIWRGKGVKFHWNLQTDSSKKMQTEGAGWKRVKNCVNFADVLNGYSLRQGPL